MKHKAIRELTVRCIATGKLGTITISGDWWLQNRLVGGVADENQLRKWLVTQHVVVVHERTIDIQFAGTPAAQE